MSSGKITNKKHLLFDIEESPKAVTKIKVVGDSHARGFAKLIQEKTMSEMVVEELVYPGAKLGEVFSFAKEAHLSTCDYLFITAGVNDAYSGKATNVLKNMKSVLISLRPCKIILGGIPFRQDLPLYHRGNGETIIILMGKQNNNNSKQNNYQK